MYSSRMKYKTKGKLVSATIHDVHSKSDITNVLVGLSKNKLRHMVKDQIKRILAKGHTVRWNVGTKYEVSMFKESELSGYDKEDSEFITSAIHTIVGADGNRKAIIHHEKTRRNPEYEGNPDCGLCYEKTTKLYPDHLLDDAKTRKNVCSKCKKQLSKMRKILAEMEKQ